jgi:hypothetical protein
MINNLRQMDTVSIVVYMVNGAWLTPTSGAEKENLNL